MELQYYLKSRFSELDLDFASGTLYHSASPLDMQSDLVDFDVFVLNVPGENPSSSVGFREQFYSLYSHFDIKICDCGDIISGNSVSDTTYAIKYVLEFLSSFDKSILLIGSNFTTSFLRDFVYPKTEVSIAHNCLRISNHSLSDIGIQKDIPMNFIGTQTYLTSESDFQRSKMNDDLVVRLGLLADKPFCIEPLLRDSSVLIFNTLALHNSFLYNRPDGSTNGISNHNACQYGYYFGRSSSAKYFLIDLQEESEPHLTPILVNLVAQIYWHFLLGRSHELKYDPETWKYKSYYLSNIHDNIEFCFFEDISTSTWWLKITNCDDSFVIASSLEEYNYLLGGEISDRIIKKIKNFKS